MNAQHEKTAALKSPAATGAEQPLSKETSETIAKNREKGNPQDAKSTYYPGYDDWYDPDAMETVSMTELYETTYSSRPPIIDGLLHTGTYLFAGAPKVGKSFLMAQMAYHVSAGLPLWGYPVRKGTVLYLALEDDYRRLQARLYRMFGTESTDQLRFSVCAKKLGLGLDGQLNTFMRSYPDTRLIIIDTLQKIRKSTGDKCSYATDYEVIGQLRHFADAKGICLLLVHHTRKQQSDDHFDMISGTNGLMGAADGAFLLHKESRTGPMAKLEISGRDQQDQRLILRRNQETLAWELDRAEVDEFHEAPDPVLDAVAMILTDDRQEWSGTATELAAMLSIDVKPISLAMRLNIQAGRLLEKYGIQYESTRSHQGRSIRLRLLPRAA